MFIELTSQLHRTLVPIPVWLFYLLDQNERIPSKVLGVILTAAYMVFKGKSILKTALAWKLAATKLMQSTVSFSLALRVSTLEGTLLFFLCFQRYGKSPSHDELKASGGTCPICHDNLSEPTKLHCKHIFCEECVATWFDREKTCPMCRAQVRKKLCRRQKLWYMKSNLEGRHHHRLICEQLFYYLNTKYQHPRN